MKKSNKPISLILSYLKIGFIGFGGGSALIPVIQKECVEENTYIEEEEFLKHTIISNITPGTLPVKLGALSTDETSVPAAYAVTLPGVIMTLLFMTLFSIIGEHAVQYIEYASVGISVFIIILLISYIQKVQNTGKSEGVQKGYVLIMLISFILTCGKVVLSFLSILINKEIAWTPLFSISTINLMIIAFFFICFLGNSRSRTRFAIASILSATYALTIGKGNLIPKVLQLNIIIPISMLLLVLFSIMAEKRASDNRKTQTAVSLFISKACILNICVFTLIPIILLVILYVCGGKNLQNGLFLFIGNSVLSTATSFGGGEAYISVAEGFFVEPGFISIDVYYSQIVAISNALPGPILVKVLSAVGYVYGSVQCKSVLIGWLLAITAMSIGITVSSIVALIIKSGFEILKNSPRLIMIKQYILPVVCGMLISTSLSMLIEALKIIQMKTGPGVTPMILGLVFILFLYFIMVLMHKKFHISDIFVLFCGGGLSLIALLFI